MKFRNLLAAMAMLLWPVSTVYAWDTKEMNTLIDQTNFVINRGCSGTLIDKTNGYILTAHHCIDTQYETVTREFVDDEGEIKTKKIRIARPGVATQINYVNGFETNRSQYVVSIKGSDRNLDLAVMKVQSTLPNTMEARLACDDPIRGDVAYVVGNPLGDLYSTIHKGVVSSIQRNYPLLGIDDQGQNALMQISAGLIGGNSGGAVYNNNGFLIGVPVRGSRINEVLGFAVPLKDVKSFLKTNNIETECGR